MVKEVRVVRLHASERTIPHDGPTTPTWEAELGWGGLADMVIGSGVGVAKWLVRTDSAMDERTGAELT